MKIDTTVNINKQNSTFYNENTYTVLPCYLLLTNEKEIKVIIG